MSGEWSGLYAVGRTALWTAAARAAETERADRLFTDEFAAGLAGPAGFALMEHFEQFTGGRNPVLPLRTRFYDDVIATHVRDGPVRQVVLVAAGLDARAFRLSWPGDTTVFEIDQPELLADKDAALAQVRAQPACDRRVVGADLTGDWIGDLVSAGYTQQHPCLWIAEGLLSYLPGAAVAELLRTTARHSASGSRLATDFIGETFLSSPAMAAQRAAVAEINAPWLYGCDQPEQLFTSCGWLPERVLQPGEPGADFRPLPFPTVPRDVEAPGLPRLFFTIAVKP